MSVTTYNVSVEYCNSHSVPLLFRSMCRRKNFVVPGELSGFLESRGNGAIFFLAELDGLSDAGFLELAAEAVEDVELGPDLRGIGGTLSGADDF